MIELPSDRHSEPLRKGRRSKGSGSKAFWNAERQLFQAQVSLGDGRRVTIRARDEAELERRRDALVRQVQVNRGVAQEQYPSADVDLVHVLVRLVLEDERLLDRIADKLRARL